MMRNFLDRVLQITGIGRRVSRSKPKGRRFAVEPLESRRLLAVTGSISGYALLPSGAGFAGLTVQIDSVDIQGNLSSVSGVGPTQTASDGSYSFTGLSAGSFEVQVSPSSKLAMGTPSPGSAGGTASNNDIQLTLAAGQSATDYNFSVLGAQTGEISLRMFLSSTGTLSQFLTSLHAPPAVDPSGASSSYSATYTTGGSGVAIASSTATISEPDSPTLTSMTVTIDNPLDGSGEKLSATTTGALTSSYANNVLTVSGVADLATYETVLQSVLYSDTAVSATPGSRTLSVVVNDGTDTSTAATSTITVVLGTQTAPSVTSVSPSSGSASGGSVVTINGTGFTAGATVNFGTAAATNVTEVSATQITATAPAGTGVVDITVTTAGGTSATSSSDQFSYTPSVTSVSPSSGPASGGTVVTINGSDFTSASTVNFGTVAATNVTDVSATQITATAPAGAGVVDVSVTTAEQTSAASSSDQFSYVPSVTSLSPSSGAAGAAVTINGTGFTSASTVKFGTTAATSVTFVSATQLTATAPAGSGVSDVTVTTAGETSATSSSDQFTYSLSVTSISPSSGPASGGTVVTINGSDFTAASTVMFGTTAATNVTLVSATQITATAPAGAGLVDVTVTTAGQTTATSSSDQFGYVPSVTGISPTSGSAGGGTLVTINGTGFTAASTVKFGTTAATNVTFVSATQLTATAPAGAGLLDVTVTTAGQTSATSSSDQFGYLPSVTSVSPNSGPAGGGTVVTINGSGFTAAATVKFGTIAATNVAFVSATQLTATAPAGTGSVDIVVTTAAQTSATSSNDQFNYLPSVASISPNSGPAGGGTVVTINGSGFTAASTVKFGTAAAINVSFVSATQITATTPTGAGLVDITVTTAGETSATSSSDQFSYLPSVSSINPTSGIAGGGTVVTINGTGFTSASTVKFGTVAATNVTLVSATQLTATAPAGAGLVDIVVTTSGKNSATSSNDQFSYVPSVTSVSPSSGPISGGTMVTINGSGFTAASTVKFGTIAATNVTLISATQITASAPVGAGTVDVTVTTAGETSATSASDQFSYLSSLTSISPNSGPASGGTVVTINGSGFTAGSTVAFGSTAATNVSLVSATQITATAPAGSGTVDVTVTTDGETTVTSASDQFSYLPVVSSVTPGSGAAGGGSLVTINGSGFTAASTVKFGTAAASNVNFVTATQLTATAPAGAGLVDIVVTTSGEASATSSNDQFSYLPSVTGISPTSGSAAGGSVVTINGTGFTSTSTVKFGTTAATNVTFVSATQITATAPEGVGTVDLTVTTDGEISATSSSDQFAYVPTVTSVSPASVPVNGGTLVTINGSGFSADSTVTFGANAAANVTYISPTQLTVIAPAGSGTVDVTVTTAGETSVTNPSTDQFSYLPTVTSISPTSGPASGGTMVTIDGTGFTAASTVEFGTAAAMNVNFVSATQITATAPAGAGLVDITVTTAGETSTTSSNDQFSYVPSVASVSPTSGVGSGGTVVTIDGAGFTAASTVDFGTTAATHVTFVSTTQISATAPAGAGLADITVTTAGETSATSSNDQFNYVPTVTSVSPNSGSTGGGTVVTIHGAGFTAASTVAFGTTAATNVTYVSATQITATAPAGTGAVDITVSTAGETSATSSSDEFSYGMVATSVTSVSPASGPAVGGTVVTINGTGFTAASTVNFGAAAATNVTYVSATQITATSPAGAIGTVDITVTTGSSTSATSSSDQFSYLPTVTSVSPTSGPGDGGTVVTINGTGFTAASTVHFGLIAAASVTEVSATQLTATSPAGAGVVDITVTTSGEASATSSSDQFSYLPSVTSVSPASGPASGGTVVTINGTGFTAGSTNVEFGTAAGTAITFVSATQLTVTSPAGAGGVDITVTTPGGTSATSSSDQFTYSADITADQATLDSTNATAAGFTIAGGTTGEAFTYSVQSSGGSATVTGSGTLTSTSQDVTGINVSSLPAGTLTYTVTLANNPGTPLTATAKLGLIVTSAPATTATVGQVYTYTVVTNAPSGDTVTVTPGTMPTGMTFDAASQTFTWTPTSDQAGTAPSFTATITDSLSNSTTLGPTFVQVAAANGLTVIAPAASVTSGSPVLVAFNNSNSGTPTYTVTASSSSDPTGADLTATLMPDSNPVLKIVTSLGEMDFQLLDNYTPVTVSHLESLINSNTYSTGASFYRIIQTFVDQGGVGGTSSTIPVELNPDLRFTSSGLLSLANDGVDGNGSEFFITNPDNTDDGFLDFRYTIFGKLIKGDNVRQAIAATPVTTNSSTNEDSQPLVAPEILSMSIGTESDAGVFMLKAASGATGPYTVTVSDGLGHSQTFTINVAANSYDPPNPWVAPINGTDTLTTAANTPVTFTPQGMSADGTSVQISAELFEPVPAVSGAYVDSSYTGTNPPADTTNPYVSLSQNGSSFTVTPVSGFYGVQVVEVKAQSATAASWDASSGVNPVYEAYVPIYVNPPAPVIGSITAGGQTVSGTTPANNSTQGTELSFNITGAVAGATVSVYMDGGTTPIATGTVASGATTITVTTDGSTTISAGSHTFTAAQSIATPALELYAEWYTGSQGLTPGEQFPIPASSVNSPASAGTSLSITAPVPPSGYSITPDQSTIDAAQANSIGFTFAGATPDTTYHFTITSDGNGGKDTPVTGSGSVTSATQDVTGISVSSLSAGNLTISVTLTDQFGDVGPAATATALLDLPG
jgi:large repetitive protein